MIELLSSDILIIGSGIAGLAAALEVCQQGRRARVVSKSSNGKANNTYLAGGMFTCATDSFSRDEHFSTTLDNGRMLNHPEIVSDFVAKAPEKVQQLIDRGMKGAFQNNGFHCRTTGFIGGPSLSRLLVSACQEAEVDFAEQICITRLLVADGCLHGALGFHKATGRVYAFQSHTVILATGGAGSIFLRSDNAPGALGDGYALGLFAGLELIDMEFVQFYPLVHAESVQSHMLLPAVFADFGLIRNRLGENIKDKYELPDKGAAIVARDRLSQAMYTEIKAGRSIDGALHLDLQDADWQAIPMDNRAKTKFIHKTASETSTIKVAPAAHHTMGGIVTDTRGRTTVKGLYAVGEVVGGIHGANRVGGNALGEALVSGENAARSACHDSHTLLSKAAFESLVQPAGQELTSYSNRPGNTTKPGPLLHKLKQTLWEQVGIIRKESSLKSALEQIEEILQTIRSCTPQNIQELFKTTQTQQAALTAKAVTLSALKRTESRGAHFRKDWPQENPAWLKHISVRLLDKEPVMHEVFSVSPERKQTP